MPPRTRSELMTRAHWSSSWTSDQELMREGKFRHVWRVVGDVSNVSIFDVDTHAELHDILQNLPLFPYMDVKVTPLAEHPPGLPEMYAYAS